MMRTTTLGLAALLVTAACGDDATIIPATDATKPTVTLSVIVQGTTYTVRSTDPVADPHIVVYAPAVRSASFLANVTDTGGVSRARVVATFGTISNASPADTTVTVDTAFDAAQRDGTRAAPLRRLLISGDARSRTINAPTVVFRATGIDFGGRSGTPNVATTRNIEVNFYSDPLLPPL